jgi:hypothetical protein
MRGYWKDCKSSKDDRMTVKQSLIIFLIVSFLGLSPPVHSSDSRGIKASSGPGPSYHLGNYHGLIIGINAYQNWSLLQTAVNDAIKLKQVLIEKYGFNAENVTLRTDNDATRYRLIDDLRNIASRLNENDNFLIYFAGHGQLDDLTGDGYWIPVEGKLKDTSSWIAHSTVKNILSSEKVKGKNIVVIADSCYSGTLLRGGQSSLSPTERNYNEKLLERAARRSRQVISSGGLEPVADGGRDGHSLFAYYFLKALKENERNIVDLENLFHSQVWEAVSEIGDQRPTIGRLKTPMDEDGQFVLTTGSWTSDDSGNMVEEPLQASTTRDDEKALEVELLFWETVKDSNNRELYTAYLEKFPDGSFTELAKKKIEDLSQSDSKDTKDESVFNPKEPWTGVWKVQASPRAGIYAMKQNGEKVVSTRESYYKFEGKARGNRLRGSMVDAGGSIAQFELVMSEDGTSFKGRVGSYNAGIIGRRILK